LFTSFIKIFAIKAQVFHIDYVCAFVILFVGVQLCNWRLVGRKPSATRSSSLSLVWGLKTSLAETLVRL